MQNSTTYTPAQIQQLTLQMQQFAQAQLPTFIGPVQTTGYMQQQPLPAPPPTPAAVEKKTYGPTGGLPRCQAFKNCVVTYEPGQYGYGTFKLYNHLHKMPMMLSVKDVREVLEALPMAYNEGRQEQRNINEILEKNGWLMTEGKYSSPPSDEIIPLYKEMEDRVIFKYPFKSYTNKQGIVNDYFITAESYQRNVLIWIKSVYYPVGQSFNQKPGGSSVLILVDEPTKTLEDFFIQHKPINKNFFVYNHIL